MPDEPFTVAEVHADIHAWAKRVPTLGAMDDWLFRIQVDDAKQVVTGWLTFTRDKRVVEQCEDISYSLILDFANRFGSPLTVLDQWFIAMCEKAKVSIPLFPERSRRIFS